MKNRTSQPKEVLRSHHYIILGQSVDEVDGKLPKGDQPKVQCYLCKRNKDARTARFNQETKELESYSLDFGSVSSLTEHADGRKVSFIYSVCSECLALLKAISKSQSEGAQTLPQPSRAGTV